MVLVVPPLALVYTYPSPALILAVPGGLPLVRRWPDATR